MAIDSISGPRDGIKRDNRDIKRVGSIPTPQELRDFYLFGIEIRDNNGQELSDLALQRYIDQAVSLIEHDLDLSLTPQQKVERRDYHLNDYADWGYYQLNDYPVIQIDNYELVYFQDDKGNEEAVQEIPKNWIRLDDHAGIVRLIPNARFPAKLQVDNAGNFFPELLRADIVPHAWKITYTHGFESGKVPMVLVQTIGYIAAIQALIIAGNLVIGAGIASESVGIDGLSQSIVTTSSAENSSYSATIKEYQRVLFGDSKDDPTALIKIARHYYKGQSINII